MSGSFEILLKTGKKLSIQADRSRILGSWVMFENKVDIDDYETVVTYSAEAVIFFRTLPEDARTDEKLETSQIGQ